MKNEKIIGIVRYNKAKKGERGFTLLEYCAGAAMILAIIFVVMQAMEGSMSGLMDNVNTWLTKRGEAIANQEEVNR